MSLGGGNMSAELTQGDAGLDLRFNEECPPGITEYASIWKASAFFLVSEFKLARDLLFCYPKLANGRDVICSCPAEERPEQSAVSIEGACQRVGEPVFWLEVLIKDVSHDRK
jgi:hypothetical protein